MPTRILGVLLLAAAVIPAGAGPKPKVAKEKGLVLEWLSRPEVVEKFGRISDAIWGYAELGLQEFRSSKLLADTLEAAGFRVERGLAGMPTCFVASYGSGKPVIGLLGEFDALPMLSQKPRTPKQDPLVEGAPGHGCGHNTMCTAAAAAAIAVKEAMDEFGIKGTIKVFGSPGEEIVASRPYMIRAGLLDGVDAVIDNHSTSGFGTDYGVSGNAVFSTIFSFKGRTAHAAGAPWAGRSALDAIEIMDVAANFLREHLPISQRLHYVILEGGEAPNVVPDKASVWYYVRNSDELVESMYERVVNCAKAGALASGTELLPPRVISAVHQRHANKAAAELFQKNIELVGMPRWTEDDQGPPEGTWGRADWHAFGSQHARSAERGLRRRRLFGRRGRDAHRADRDHHLPRPGAACDRPSLVYGHRGLRLHGLEGAERRGQGHRRIGDRPPDAARRAQEAPVGIRGIFQDAPIQAVLAGRREASARTQRGADEEVPAAPGEIRDPVAAGDRVRRAIVPV
jgi:amidohydrolase